MINMTIKEICQAILDGKDLEVLMLHPNIGDTDHDWVLATNELAIQKFCISPDYVRIKPALTSIDLSVLIKPALTSIDLSVLIKSGIDCEFLSGPIKVLIGFGPLKKIAGHLYQPVWTNIAGYDYCRPRTNHWHAWNGGECPLPEGLLVELRYRVWGTPIASVIIGQVDEVMQWAHVDHLETSRADIIAFKIIGLAEGYCWPWEMSK